jgi:hypothetical protein
MARIQQDYDAHTIGHLLALFEELPSGCDPDFDNAAEELERQFAELRLSFDHSDLDHN